MSLSIIEFELSPTFTCYIKLCSRTEVNSEFPASGVGNERSMLRAASRPFELATLIVHPNAVTVVPLSEMRNESKHIFQVI